MKVYNIFLVLSIFRYLANQVLMEPKINLRDFNFAILMLGSKIQTVDFQNPTAPRAQTFFCDEIEVTDVKL